MKWLSSVRSFVSKHRILTAFVCIVLVGWAFFAIKDWVETPGDLGPRIEYIGKQKSGCAPAPLSFICIGPIYTEYYFATDLSLAELPAYFKHAKQVGDYDFLPNKSG